MKTKTRKKYKFLKEGNVIRYGDQQQTTYGLISPRVWIKVIGTIVGYRVNGDDSFNEIYRRSIKEKK